MNLFSTTKISQITESKLEILYQYRQSVVMLYYVRWIILPVIFLLIYLTKIEIIPLKVMPSTISPLLYLFLISIFRLDYKRLVKINKEGIYITRLFSRKTQFIKLDDRRTHHFKITIRSDYALIRFSYLTIKINEIDQLPLVLDTIANLWQLRLKSSKTLSNRKGVMTYVSTKKFKNRFQKRIKGRQNQNNFKHRKNIKSKKSQQKISQFNNQKGRPSTRRNNNYRRN